MKASDLRTRTIDELRDRLTDLRKESFNLRFQAASGQLGTRRAMVRRDIARVRTLLNERGQVKAGAAK